MALPPDTHRLQPDHLPTPFSATQIREGCPLGRIILLREETPGDPSTHRQIRFVEVDPDGAVQEYRACDAGGRPSGEAACRRSGWIDLQRHASQPADATLVDEVELELPFGTFACWRYTVSASGVERRFWFARALPGMPVQVEEWSAGILRGRTLMIDNRTERYPSPRRSWGSAVEKRATSRKSRG